jgi:hypothetical protein
MKAESSADAMHFTCPRKGHVQVEEFSWSVNNNVTGEVVLDTGPLCRQCWIEDQTARYQTHRIAPPKAPRKARAPRKRAEAKPS